MESAMPPRLHENNHQHMLKCDETPMEEIEQFIAWAHQRIQNPSKDMSDTIRKMGDLVFPWTAHMPARSLLPSTAIHHIPPPRLYTLIHP